ncbi:hypothetical protein D3C81_1895710 [compost metagenome]
MVLQVTVTPLAGWPVPSTTFAVITEALTPSSVMLPGFAVTVLMVSDAGTPPFRVTTQEPSPCSCGSLNVQPSGKPPPSIREIPPPVYSRMSMPAPLQATVPSAVL